MKHFWTKVKIAIVHKIIYHKLTLNICNYQRKIESNSNSISLVQCFQLQDNKCTYFNLSLRLFHDP